MHVYVHVIPLSLMSKNPWYVLTCKNIKISIIVDPFINVLTCAYIHACTTDTYADESYTRQNPQFYVWHTRWICPWQFCSYLNIVIIWFLGTPMAHRLWEGAALQAHELPEALIRGLHPCSTEREASPQSSSPSSLLRTAALKDINRWLVLCLW